MGFDDLGWWRKSCNLQHQFTPHGISEDGPIAHRDHKGPGAADDAGGVVDIEVRQIEERELPIIGHQGQAIDGDALGQHTVAGVGDAGGKVVGAVA